MQEVTIRLRFNRACLGGTKRRHRGQTVFRMDRDAAGRIMFMPSQWLVLMRYAARVANRHHSTVRKIDWDPLIVGTPSRQDWARGIVKQAEGEASRTFYAIHEAFQPGDVVSVNALLPDGMPVGDFQPLLEIAGAYRGFSPYNNQTEKYGTFEVLSVTPRTRHWEAMEEATANGG